MAKDIKINKAAIVQDGLEVYNGTSRTATPFIGGGDGSGTTKFLSVNETVEAALADATINPSSLTIGGNITATGDVSADDLALSNDLAFTETVTTPATSSTMTLVQKQLVHTIAGGATEVLPINVPDDALLFSAEILVSVALAFTTGTAVTPTWTNSTQQIGSTTLAAKNSKVTAFYNANATSPIATGTPETITLTADLGTVDSGEVVVIVRYWTLSGITDVA